MEGVDLFSLDGQQALLCRAGNATNKDVKRFLRTANCLFEAPCCTLWTDRGCNVSADSQRWLKEYGGRRKSLTKKRVRQLCCDTATSVLTSGQASAEELSDPRLRPCQEACLEACARGARVIEMACGTGKTRVIRELATKQTGKALVTVPSRVLLEQFAEEMPGFCKVGTAYNDKIDFSCRGFISVTDSVQLLKNLTFEACFVDEAHHPLPPGMPSCKELFKFSATHKEDVDFRYSLGEAIEQGVLSDYDLTVPVTTEGHPYLCLANLLLSQAGRFRRVLAYCNSIAEAKRFRQVLETVGLAAWHINGETSSTVRDRVMGEFSDDLQKPVHVLVTVQVLGEGVNIRNADTCMFVEPRSSYVSIIQAIGRVLRPHPSKPLAHIVLPAIAMPATTNRAAVAPPGLSHPAGSAQSIARTSGSVEHFQSPESDGMQLDHHGSVDAPLVLAALGVAARNGSKNFHGRQLTDQTSETSRLAGSNEVPPAALVASVANTALGGGSSRLRTNANNHCNNHDHHETERCRCQSSLPQQDRKDSLGASAALMPESTTAFEATSLTADEQVGAGGIGKLMKQHEASWDTAAGRGFEARRPSAPAQNNRSEGRGKPTELQAASSTAGCQGDTASGAEFRFRGPNSQSPAPMTDGEQGELHDGWSNDEEAGLQTHPARPASVTPPATASQQEALLVQMGSPSRQLPVASATALEAASGTKPAEVVPRQHGAGPEPSMESEESSRSLTHRCASKLKVKRGDSAGLFGSGHADQLGRFLEAIAQADSRFANKDIRVLQSRLWVADCRLQQPAMQQILARDLQHQLALILQQRDAFDLRLQAVEKFDQDHGRLPRQRGNQLEEKSLADWLRNLGYRKMLSAERMQKLLNSSCSMLRARAAKWLEPDVFFEEVLQELRQFVHVHHRMPSAGKQHPRAERRLIESVRALASPAMKSFKRRLQLLEKVDPIVADWVKSRRTRQIRVCEVLWNSQYDRLLRFVEVNERLPRQRLERPLHSWLCRQRIQMNYLPANLQAKLIHIHPVVAAFLRS